MDQEAVSLNEKDILSTLDADKEGLVWEDSLWKPSNSYKGVVASQLDAHPSTDFIATTLGQTLRAFHDIAHTNLAVLLDTITWEDTFEQISSRLNHPAFSPTRLVEPYSRYQAEELLTNFTHAKPQTIDDDLVVSFGYQLADLAYVEGDRVAALKDIDQCVIADRYYDLAINHINLHALIGPEALYSFYDGYGTTPNIVKLDHYIMAATLLSKGTPC